MKEVDYVNATNLAMIRAARSILRDTLPDEGQHYTFFETAMAALRQWERELEKVVKTTE